MSKGVSTLLLLFVILSCSRSINAPEFVQEYVESYTVRVSFEEKKPMYQTLNVIMSDKDFQAAAVLIDKPYKGFMGRVINEESLEYGLWALGKGQQFFHVPLLEKDIVCTVLVRRMDGSNWHILMDVKKGEDVRKIKFDSIKELPKLSVTDNIKVDALLKKIEL